MTLVWARWGFSKGETCLTVVFILIFSVNFSLARGEKVTEDEGMGNDFEPQYGEELQANNGTNGENLLLPETGTNETNDEYSHRIGSDKENPIVQTIGTDTDKDSSVQNSFLRKYYSSQTSSNFPSAGPSERERLYVDGWRPRNYCAFSVFSSEFSITRPFYVWPNDKWQVPIKKLLAGEAVQFHVDVDMEDQDSETISLFRRKSAIKFSKIELYFKAGNASRQAELDEKLRYSFVIDMLHSGVSLYRMTGQHFASFDRDLRFWFSFQRDVNNGHVSQNGVKLYYDKLDDTEVLLSPYTWWTFQLRNAARDGQFTELEDFGDEVSLELQGRGVYLQLDEWRPELYLGEYYHAYDPDDSQWKVLGREVGNMTMKW